MSPNPELPKIIWGTVRIAQLDDKEKFLEILEKYGVKDLDTAHVYPESEKALGAIGAPKRFTIHTKAPGFRPGAMTKSNVLAGMENSLKLLGVDQVETYFLHSPDADTPLEETLAAINELHTRNTFRAFGISNFTPSDVEKIHSICTSNSYVLPTVYQGNYNPVSRAYETTLFPLLRKLNISFYAYSPIAGGFLVKTAEAIQGGTAGRRWDTSNPAGSLYPGLYKKPALLKALADWNDIASDAGVGRAELAYRWVAYHSNIDKSKGDAVIIGASKPEQLEETLGALNAGPLDEGIAERVRGIYESVKHEAPVDNFHGENLDSSIGQGKYCKCADNPKMIKK